MRATTYDLMTPKERAFLDRLRRVFCRLPPSAQDDIAAASLKVKVPELFTQMLKVTGDLGLAVPAQHQAAYADLEAKDAQRRQAISNGHKSRKQAKDEVERADRPQAKSPLEKLIDMAPPDPRDQTSATPAVGSTSGQAAPPPRSTQAFGHGPASRPDTKPLEEPPPHPLRPVPPKSTT